MGSQAKEIPARPIALVLGAGAQGLACTLRLWERGWDVVVVARDWLTDTTSTGAGAIWEYPPFQVEPKEKAKKWVMDSLICFEAAAVAAGADVSGIRLRRSWYLFRNKVQAEQTYGPFHEWNKLVRDFCEGLPEDGLLRNGHTFTYAFSYVAPIVNMRRYLTWLTQLVGGLIGVRFVRTELDCLASVRDVASRYSAWSVVNCLGLGSKLIFGDNNMFAVRGDLVYVLAPGAEERYDFAQVSDEDDPAGELTYVVPQGDGIVGLAGTAIEIDSALLDAEGYRPLSERNRGITTEDEQLRRNIVARVLAAMPGAVLSPTVLEASVADGQPTPEPVVIGSWCGARPQRHGGVRLEYEEIMVEDSRLRVVHNYGHGGSGVVSSWGCAEEVVMLADRSLPETIPASRPDDDQLAFCLQSRSLPSHVAGLALERVRVARVGKGLKANL